MSPWIDIAIILETDLHSDGGARRAPPPVAERDAGAAAGGAPASDVGGRELGRDLI